ncbi:MAG: AbiTii domain-containing protein [Nitrospiraceae bacterium]
MKLLDDIIGLLSDENGSLTAALLKTKVLMHTLGYADLVEWVNDELSGYPKDKPVPPYRIVPGRVVGNIQDDLMIQTGVSLPTMHLPKKLKDWLENHKLRETMSVLEGMSESKDGKLLQMRLSPEIGAQIDKGMDGYWVQQCWVEFSSLQIKNGITQVRSRLLDFALNLRDKIGDVEENEVKVVAQKNDVPAMFHGAVFGDNAVVLIGDHNQTTISNVVKKGDFESLAAWLKKGKVEEVDIVALKQAIHADEEVSQGEYGERVKAWMRKMTGKAIDGSWNIGIGAAGTLLAEGLKAFFGR